MQAPLGLISGLGDLPVRIAEAVTARGQSVHIVRLKGFVEPKLSTYPGETLGFAEIGKALRSFKQAGCRQICFAGDVKRPDLSALKPDLKGMSLLPKAIAASRKGDDALLRFMIGVFEAEGLQVIGTDEALGDNPTRQGVIAGPQPSAGVLDDLHKASEVALAIGALDIGQGAIVCRGLVLCVEAQEGTDAMLARCAALPAALRGTLAAPEGALVKRLKPIQDRRIDLPTIGPATIDGAHRAGLAAVGYEAGGAHLIDFETIAQKAETYGITLYALAAQGPS
ncbi:MAG: UDP-2,3-diacylglucosamine diphosphatase LpxI [Pseudomonadota bacterium]